MDMPHNMQSPVEWAVASRAMPGQSVSGDLHLVKPQADGVLLAVADGLGHGEEATLAAQTAMATLEKLGALPVITLMQRCNEALIKTRGVVMTLAAIQSFDNTVTWLGVGNVEGRLLRVEGNPAQQTESVLLRGGVVGYQMPSLQASVVPIELGDLLILATDGIKPDFMASVKKYDAVQAIADRVLEQQGKATDDALVLVARYLGRFA